MATDRQTEESKKGAGRNRRDAAVPAADATQYRANPAGQPPVQQEEGWRNAEAGYPGGGRSMRLGVRTVGGGLAMKIALLMILCLLAGLTGVYYIIYHASFAAQIRSLQQNSVGAANLLAVPGRYILQQRENFFREHPDYAIGEEWRTGDHWLVKQGLVGEERWVEATGFHANEFAPVEVLEKSAERIALADLLPRLRLPANNIDIGAVFLLDANGGVVAASMSPGFQFDAGRFLRSIPLLTNRDGNGEQVIETEYLPDFAPEPVVRGVATIVSDTPEQQRLGTVVVLLRTVRITANRHSYLFLIALLFLSLLVGMTIVALLASRRAIRPMRRLIADMQAMAKGDYTRRSALASTEDETGQLALAFNSMAERLRVARASEKETSRLESDLAVARRIQSSLLPPQTPRVRGLDIHITYRPALEIGGDYYDFLPVDNQHMGVVIADASGKSIPAALVMSITRAILRFVAPGNLSAAETLNRVNTILSVDIPRGMFVTACYIILDPVEQSMLIASAGHTPLLLARADGSVEMLNPGGIALGFDSGAIFQCSIREQKVMLAPGDRVLLYTDGVVECANPANEEYTDRRLREFLRRHRDLSSHDFVGALLTDLDRHRSTADIRDDTTIVTFKVI